MVHLLQIRGQSSVGSAIREYQDPSDEEIKEYLAGNLCRCSGYEGQMRGIKAFLEYKKNGGSR